jgi:hypothetical protein
MWYHLQFMQGTYTLQISSAWQGKQVSTCSCFISIWCVHYFKFGQECTAVAQDEFIELFLDSFKAAVKDTELF